MAALRDDPFGVESTLVTQAGAVRFYSLSKLAACGTGKLDQLPFSIRVLLENVLRNVDGFQVTAEDVTRLAAWSPKPAEAEVPFKPGRVILQDFTGVPALVDLAAMRAALKRLGGDPRRINPEVPCDLIIDHSVQVDAFGRVEALRINQEIEFERNRERYAFLKWGQQAFDNFRVVPPATGIIHQVNLEYLAKVVLTRPAGGHTLAFPDSVVGTDSHTTMINGLGVVGWGVGGIEAEAVMLGQPIYMLSPEVIGFRLSGQLPEGATATDLVLTVTEMLRAKGVVGKFVEFFGPGLAEMSPADRATLANMSPEYGATMGFFPVDEQTLWYLAMTGRPVELIDLVERYCKEQGLFRGPNTPDPVYSDTLELDMSTVEPCLAGPRRPQDRVPLKVMKKQWRKDLTASYKIPDVATEKGVDTEWSGWRFKLNHGAVVIASITSCTNTSNPSVMLGAGLLARRAVEKGLACKPWVKTSLAPGSRVVTDYLIKAGLMPSLERLGFHVVGYGCTTCIGNSGPLPEPIADAITKGDLVVASVLSGNRNFEGRVNPLTKANYLASPLLVVAYALAGTTDIDLTCEPIGKGSDGRDVYLKDIWPGEKEIREAVERCVSPEQFSLCYARVFEGDELWRSVPCGGSELYDWDVNSTYIQEVPFFTEMATEAGSVQPITGARCLVMVGDSVTTDHISPAGSIKPTSPAGLYLQSLGVKPADFNSYGARRGNDRVMVRGTFANIRLRNLLAPGTEGCTTVYLPTGEQMSIYDAALKYRETGTPLIVLAGKEYGTGSSRDWAAKGPMLLGIRAVIAESFERIHRSNLVGMGILPLQYKPGRNRESLGLMGTETFDILGLSNDLKPRQDVKVVARRSDGAVVEFTTICRIDTPPEIEYYRNGGILQTVIRRMLRG
ncbi:MAG TPA: aconitate hydratase AcnA [Phycisphaerae bacterium]|nr:aconitate hydratase AcnA [Phycisphaerae bacterium]HRR84976.1 aconitate hydratase AcnA [Phycisphaerae bacterium]